jgi:hypothetical protein
VAQAHGDEQDRWIGRSLGYASHPLGGLRGEPQAISGREQAAQTRAAHAKWKERERRAWGTCHAEISGALARFNAAVRVDRRTQSDLKVVERVADRVDRRLGQ